MSASQGFSNRALRRTERSRSDEKDRTSFLPCGKFQSMQDITTKFLGERLQRRIEKRNQGHPISGDCEPARHKRKLSRAQLSSDRLGSAQLDSNLRVFLCLTSRPCGSAGKTGSTQLTLCTAMASTHVTYGQTYGQFRKEFATFSFGMYTEPSCWLSPQFICWLAIRSRPCGKTPQTVFTFFEHSLFYVFHIYYLFIFIYLLSLLSSLSLLL